MEKQKYSKKEPDPASLCLPQNPYRNLRARKQARVVKDRRLTIFVTAVKPEILCVFKVPIPTSQQAVSITILSPAQYWVIKSGRMRWAGHVARVGEESGVYRVLVGKPEGRRPLGRPRRRWVDNIRMELQEVGCGYMDWIGLAQDRDKWRTLVSAVMNLRVL